MKKIISSLIASLLIVVLTANAQNKLPANLSPNPNANIKMTDETTFKWSGPGNSKFPFSQYLICFVESSTGAFSCLNTDQTNYKKMTLSDWAFIEREMQAVKGDTLSLNWHIQSRFRDGTVDGEELFESDAWKINVKRDLPNGTEAINTSLNLSTTNKGKVEVVDYKAGINAVVIKIKNQNLTSDQYYASACEPKDDLDNLKRSRYLHDQATKSTGDVFEINIGPLESNVEYRCYVATSKKSGNGYSWYNHSDFFFIKTKALSNVSEKVSIEATLEEKTSKPIAFKIPPAGFEDEVITKIDLFDNPFPDTNSKQLEGQAAAELYRRAVIGGFPDGEFKGGRAVNRAEAAKFLLLARFEKVNEVENNGKFLDVANDQWYTRFVITAANKGIINGHPNGNFKPADQVNTAEFLKMLSLTFGLDLGLNHNYTDVNNEDWFSVYAGIALKYNLFPDRKNELKPSQKLSRNEVAVAIYQYLSNR